MQNIVVLDGQISQSSSISELIQNRAFLYADGFFETMIWKNGHVSFFNDHYTRIQAAIRAFYFEISYLPSEEDLLQKINKLIKTRFKKSGQKIIRVKINFWRRSGGLYAPEDNGFHYIITVNETTKPVEDAGLAIIDYEYPIHYSTTSSFKSLSATPYVLGGLKMKANLASDIIFTNQHKQITECLYSNIFWVKDNEIFTPSIKTGCIEGIMRKQILNECGTRSIPFQTGEYTESELMQADSIFTTNVGGIRYIKSVGTISFSAHPLVDEFKRQLN